MRNTKPWYNVVKNVVGFEEPVVPPVTPPVTPPPGTEEVPPVTPPVEETPPAPEDTTGLKSALEKERADRKALEKRVKAYEKAQQEKDDAEKTEVQRLADQNSTASQKVAKLAAGFRKTAVEAAIVKAAGKANFTDPTDALRQEVIEAIGVEQDEDDPTQVTIDEASVTEAIKQLARAKPHYLGQQKTPPPPSGSKFGGNNNNHTPAMEQQLAARYPALARRMGS